MEAYKRIKNVGNKASGLLWLKKHGYTVPPFSVIPQSAMKSLFKKHNISLFASDAPQKIDGLSLSGFVLKYIGGLKEPYAVRSSSGLEDGKRKSGAGQFNTLLSVKLSDLESAVKSVWKSAVLCRGQNAKPSFLAVIIQEMCLGERSGVCFTKDPSDGCNLMLIETVSGLGDALVGGSQTPKAAYFDKRDLNGNFNPHTQEAKAAFLLKDIEEQYGQPADIEFTVTDKQPVLLQIRPITTKAPPCPAAVLRALALSKLKNYQFNVKRNFVWLATSVHAAAANAEYQKSLFGFGLSLDGCLVINGAEYYSEQYLEKERVLFADLYAKNKLSAYMANVNGIFKQVEVVTSKLAGLNAKALTDAKLALHLVEFFEVYKAAYACMLLRPDAFLAQELTQRLKSDFKDEEVDTLISAATDISRCLMYAQETEDFLRAAKTGDFKAHSKEYGWINSPLALIRKPFSIADYNSRLKDCGDINLKIAQIEENKKIRAAAKKDALLKLTDETRLLAELLAEFKYLRTFTAERSDKLFCFARNTVLKEYAKRNGLSLAHVLMSSLDEIIGGNPAGRKTISRRKKGKLFLFEDKTFLTESGTDVKKAEDAFANRFNRSDGALKGALVCAGSAKGRARIIKDSRDASTLQKGEILIASMLTPDLTLAFFKASAVITEEGGVTCHAAIIAREYNLPCITGVKGIMSRIVDGQTIAVANGLITITEVV